MNKYSLIIFLFSINFAFTAEISKPIELWTLNDVQNYFQDPIYEDSWYGVYDLHGTKIGWDYIDEYLYENFFVSKNSGYLKYKDIIDDYGTEIVDKTIISYEFFSYFENEYPYRFSHFISKNKINDDVINLKGEVKNNSLTVTSNYNGIITELVKEDFIISFVDMYTIEILMRNNYDFKVGEVFNWKAIDYDDFEINSVKDSIIEIGNLFKEGVKIKYYKLKTIDSDSGFNFTGIYQDNGKLLEMDLSDEKYILQSKEEAMSNISFGGITYEEYGIIKTDKFITSNENLRKLILLIDGEFPEGIYTGYRQALIKEDGLNYLHLGYDIGKPENANASDVEENLKETLFYPINHNDIKKMLNVALPDKSIDDREKVNKLVKFVSNYIEDDYVSNSTSALDIIKRGKGDCSEHALLFNTLARSAGVPSREVEGFIHTWKNEFGYHAWNEVVIDGVWKPVDPTWELIETPVTHIKFDDNFDVVNANFNFRIMEEYYQ